MKNLSLPVLLLLFVMWITPGLVGREPWKADEPYSFNIVQHMMQSGDWVVPSVTGETFLEKPPLFFIVSACFGRLFAPPLELYDAARLAAALFMFLALLFFALAARELYGKDYGALAAVLLIGCVHLQVTGHKLMTDVGLFTGFAVAFYGLALCLRSPRAGGFWLGAGTGIGFLTKGLIAPGMLGIIAVALPVLFPRWRKKDYVIALAVALAAALPWLVIWPTALYRRSPELFVHWFWNQNFGRFLGFNPGGSVGFNVSAPDPHYFYLRSLLGIGWPVVVPAFWSLWHFRRSWREHPLFQLPLVSFIVLLMILSASSTSRTLYAVPMLLPLTLLAIPGVDALPGRAKVIVSRTSVLLFGVVALLLWLGWLAMMTGLPVVIAQKLREFQPDYVPAVNIVLLAAAVLYSLAWLFIVIRLTRSPDWAAVNWTLGVVLAWGLVMTLWLPALNAGSSYRAAFTALKQSLPEKYSCVASRGLGESERSMLEYFAGLRTRRIEEFGPGNCELLLDVQGGEAPVSVPPPAWRKIWEFRRRPNSRDTDLFTLYTKGR
jgi:4-amino-4-deoxy-L-arabinose transferase-like glycosyltransferase